MCSSVSSKPARELRRRPLQKLALSAAVAVAAKASVANLGFCATGTGIKPSQLRTAPGTRAVGLKSGLPRSRSFGSAFVTRPVAGALAAGLSAGALAALRRGKQRGFCTMAAQIGSKDGKLAHVLVACTEYRQETAILQRSCVRNGFTFRTVGLGEPWGGFATKLLAYDAALKQLVGTEIHKDDIVLLMDAWDTVILGTVDELMEKIADVPPEVVLCGSERVCGPNHFLVGDMEALFPDGRTPWRYPNSGGLVGRAAAMAALFHGLVYEMPNGQAIPADDNDQVRLHDFLIDRAAAGNPFPFRLDTSCQIFQCMYEELPQWDIVQDAPDEKSNALERPRIVNKVTGQRPVVAHGNGHTGRWFFSSLYSDMKLLDYLGLTMEEIAHLKHEMPVAPGTQVTEEVKKEYCPWWYMPGMHKGATDGFATFYMIRRMQCGDR
eukprot:TRINITY_DN30529_c0_g1_i1.p1 TRINITY_DN30529_c0_g1~~TRINITY_DN30529_c0_g1_i1.p1  ORF type:complete len:437 (-),score=87.64 TRINITY_DN30529_c0_g1_i1:14-1324(-)